MNIDFYYHSPEGLVCPSNRCGLFSCAECRLKKFIAITKYPRAQSSICYFCGLKTIFKGSAGIVPKCSSCRKIHYDSPKRGLLDRCTCPEKVGRVCDYCLLNKMTQYSDNKKQQRIANTDQNRTIIVLDAINPQYRAKAREQLVECKWVVTLKRLDLETIFHTSSLKNQSIDTGISDTDPPNYPVTKHYKTCGKSISENREDTVDGCYSVVSVSDTCLLFQKPANRRLQITNHVSYENVSLNENSEDNPDNVKFKVPTGYPSPLLEEETNTLVFGETDTGNSLQLSLISNKTNNPNLDEPSANLNPAENNKKIDDKATARSPVLSFGTGQRHRNSKTVGTIYPFNVPLTSDVATQTETLSESAELERRMRRILELEAIITSANLLHSIPTHKLQTFIQYLNPSYILQFAFFFIIVLLVH